MLMTASGRAPDEAGNAQAAEDFETLRQDIAS